MKAKSIFLLISLSYVPFSDRISSILTVTMTYTSNLLYHANKLFKKNYSDDGGSLEDVIICCEDGRSFKYSRILFNLFLQIYWGFSDLIISDDCDMIVVSFHDIGSLLYLINFFYAVQHDKSCYLCKGLSVKKLTSNCVRNKEDNNSRAAAACEDPDDGNLVIDGSTKLGDPLISIEQQSIDIIKQPQLQECSQNLKKVCEHCGLTYETAAQLKNHVYQKHRLKEVNHICEICKKVYMRRCDLRKHLISHSKKKEFKCLDCGSEFKRSQDLKKHKVDHERKFYCQICSIEIKHERSFVRHMSSHHEAKRYACPKCCKYYRKDNLARHQKTCKSTAEYNGL